MKGNKLDMTHQKGQSQKTLLSQEHAEVLQLEEEVLDSVTGGSNHGIAPTPDVPVALPLPGPVPVDVPHGKAIPASRFEHP